MRKAISICMLLGLTAVLAFAGVVKYDPADFSNKAKMAKELVNDKLKDIKKNNVKKVFVAECFGEFLVSEEVGASAFEQTAAPNFASSYQTKISKMELGDDYYETVANAVYALVANVFESNGITIVPKDVLIENQKYTDLGLKRVKKGGGYTGGVMRQSKTTETIKTSTSGMGIYTGTFSIGDVVKLSKILPNIAKDTGADGYIQIYFYVDRGKKGAPIVNNLNVLLASGLDEMGPAGKKQPYFKASGIPILTMSQPVANEADIQGPKKGTIDMAKYNAALMDIFTGVTDLYGYVLGEFLKGS